MMNKNVRIAKQLVRIAKSLIASNDKYTCDGMTLDEYSKFLSKKVEFVEKNLGSAIFTTAEFTSGGAYGSPGISIYSSEDNAEIFLGVNDDGYWQWSILDGGVDTDTFETNFKSFDDAFKSLKRHISETEA